VERSASEAAGSRSGGSDAAATDDRTTPTAATNTFPFTRPSLSDAPTATAASLRVERPFSGRQYIEVHRADHSRARNFRYEFMHSGVIWRTSDGIRRYLLSPRGVGPPGARAAVTRRFVARFSTRFGQVRSASIERKQGLPPSPAVTVCVAGTREARTRSGGGPAAARRGAACRGRRALRPPPAGASGCGTPRRHRTARGSAASPSRRFPRRSALPG